MPARKRSAASPRGAAGVGAALARKNPLRVAQQHGHSISTMLRVYAAWAQGMVESDIEAIRRAMNRHAPIKPVTRAERERESGSIAARNASRLSGTRSSTR